jgi:hypothetical protein
MPTRRWSSPTTFERAPDLGDEIWNLICLCHACHVKVTGHEENYRVKFQTIVNRKRSK